LLVQPVAPSLGNSAIPDRAVDPQLLRSWPRSLTSAPPKFCDSLPQCSRAKLDPQIPQDIRHRKTTHTHKGHATQIAAKSLLVACGCLPASPEARRVGVQTKGWSRDITPCPTCSLQLPTTYYLPIARLPALDARHLLNSAPSLLRQPSL
jgi:hypothetical protein